MKVQTLEQTLIYFFILEKSRFPPKKFYNINYWSHCPVVPSLPLSVAPFLFQGLEGCQRQGRCDVQSPSLGMPYRGLTLLRPPDLHQPKSRGHRL